MDYSDSSSSSSSSSYRRGTPSEERAAANSRWATRSELADMSDAAAVGLEGAARRGIGWFNKVFADDFPGSPRRRCCSPAALLLLYCCFTAAALLLLYCCFTEWACRRDREREREWGEDAGFSYGYERALLVYEPFSY